MSPRTLKGLAVPMFALAITAVACGGGSKEAAPAGGGAAPAATATIDPATAATITGTVKLDGTAPTPDVIKMNADPVCVKEGKGVTTEFIVPGEGGTLQNVFVYVKEGVSGTYAAPTAPVVLNQVQCHYVPHIFGIMVGQP